MIATGCSCRIARLIVDWPNEVPLSSSSTAWWMTSHPTKTIMPPHAQLTDPLGAWMGPGSLVSIVVLQLIIRGHMDMPCFLCAPHAGCCGDNDDQL